MLEYSLFSHIFEIFHKKFFYKKRQTKNRILTIMETGLEGNREDYKELNKILTGT